MWAAKNRNGNSPLEIAEIAGIQGGRGWIVAEAVSESRQTLKVTTRKLRHFERLRSRENRDCDCALRSVKLRDKKQTELFKKDLGHHAFVFMIKQVAVKH